MSQPQPAVHRTIFVVDVEGFGDRRRTNLDQVAVRSGLYHCLEQAFLASGLPWARCGREDRGDGVFILVPPDVPKAPFVDSLPGALVSALIEHNRTHAPQERIRLRMALHAGEINYDDHGVTATSINHAFRLVDAPPLKAVLAESSGVLALIVSSWFFDEVVRHCPGGDAATYRPIGVVVKETSTTAWLSLPDHPFPADPTVLEHPPPRPGPTDDAKSTPSSQPGAPQQLPAPPRLFTGRARELAQLTSFANVKAEYGGAVTISAISGMGGIGKTWLALHWAHRNLHRFPDGQLYVNLRGFDPSGSPMSSTMAVRGFLDALQLDPGAIPVDPDAQVALYRSLVSGRRMLILLDNAYDSSQVTPLLPGSPTCTVLITSRNQLAGLVTAHGAQPLVLDVLDDVDARELLSTRLGHERIAGQPAAVTKLLDCCAGLPLALGILAAYAAIHSDFPLAMLAAELDHESARLDVLDGGELSTNLKAVLSWSYQALERETANVFRLLGLAPGLDISPPAAAALTGLPLARTSVLLRKLESAHLIQQYAPGRYRMHDLIRLYAADRAGTSGSNELALQRLVAFYLHASHLGERILYPHRKPIDIEEPATAYVLPPLHDDISTLAWFDVEHSCLLAAQAAAVEHGWDTLVWQLAWTMHGYLWRRGHLHDQLATWHAGLASAQRLGDPAVQALAHRLLGQASARAGMHAEATDHLNQALELARDINDLHGEARAHHDLTWVWGHSDDEQALTHAENAVRLFQALDNPVWEAEALNAMGWHQARLGHLHEANTSCERALKLFREYENQQGQAATLTNLGYIAHHSGRYADALAFYRSSLALCRDLGATYDEADTLDHFGKAHAALGQDTEARLAWQQALILLRAQHRFSDADRMQDQLNALVRGTHR
ncbi:ATP-binding protein [Actinomadura scrupuli]|uniref:ATP-binding protein n=1 Tax=Actinomadura scrupuli TaxID=559629 RepID=UPI003D974D5C